MNKSNAIMKKTTILLFISFLCLTGKGQVLIETNIQEEGTAMSQNLFGAFFEDINYGADGGLYAELVQNRSFEYYVVPGYTGEGPLAHWSLIENEGLYANYEVVNDAPLNSNNTNYLKLTISDKNVSSPVKGKIGVGSWNTQAVFDDVKVVSGDSVWINDSLVDATNWDVRGGTFSISNDTYVQSSSDQPAWSVANINIDTTAYIYTVKAMKTGGNEGFLFPFGYKDDDNYYWLNIGGWANTQHAIEKCTAGAKSTVATVDGSISNDVWYTFTMEITDTVCKFYMDGSLLFTMDASTSENGSNSGLEGDIAGVANEGFFGMAINSGENYKFSTYLKSDAAYSGIVKVSLHNEQGNIIATDTIDAITTDWQKYNLELTASATSTDAYLSLLFSEAGIVYTDMVSLFPEETFNNRENGLRKDLAQSIADLNPSFVRFPGGCVSHGRGLDNAYRWKETVGSVEKRTPNWNLWNYHQTYGLGFYEYFLYCEDIGAKALPVVPLGVSCQFREREIESIENMGPWIEDAVDLVEFANGDITTEWGSVRAAMGHPEPFNMEYICLGNEEDDIPEFRERFIMFQDTLEKYCPEIKIIGTSGTDDAGGYYNSLWQFSKEQEIFAVDEHYYNSPEWFLENNHRYDNFDREGPKVFIGEYASQDDRLFNAISEAAYLTGVERNADVIEFTCYAPLLNYIENIPYHWHPDMILFNNTSVAKTTNYYVQQMYGVNVGDEYLNSTVSYDLSAYEGEDFSGQIGVGAWSTQAAFDDIKVSSGDKVWFEDDFSGDLSSWSVNAGVFSLSSGTYVQTGTESPAWSVASAQVDTSTYTITLRAMKTGGDEGFLFPFAYQDENNYSWFNIGGWGNTQHAYETCVNGSKSQVVTASGSINNNQWYNIKIEVTPVLTKFYLDGVLLFESAYEASNAVTSSVVKDYDTNDIILKLVNSSESAFDATINIADAQFSVEADVTLLTGATDARNSLELPNNIVPVKSKMAISNNFNYELPAYSFSVIRFTPGTTKIEEDEIENSADELIQLTPNPASSYVNIRFDDNSAKHTVILMNLNGQIVYNKSNITSDRIVIERGNMPSGTYVVRVIGESKSYSGKVVFID